MSWGIFIYSEILMNHLLHTHTHSAGYCRYDNEQNHEWSLPPRGVGLPPLEGIYFKRHSFLKRAERNGQPGKM